MSAMPPNPIRASVPLAAFQAAAAAFPGLNSWRGALRLSMGLFALSMLNTQVHGPGNSVSYGAYRWVNAGFLVRPYSMCFQAVEGAESGCG